MFFFLFLFLFFFWETGYAHSNLTLGEKKYFNIYIPWNAHFPEKLSIPALNIRTMATMSNAKMTKICNSMDFWTSKNNKNEKDDNTLSSASCKKEQNTKHENLHMDISYTTKLKGQSSFILPYALQRIKWQLCGVSKGRLNYLFEEKNRFMITFKKNLANLFCLSRLVLLNDLCHSYKQQKHHGCNIINGLCKA